MQMRNMQTSVSRDADIVVAAMVSIVGSTLIFQGWRLDPLLLLCQALTTSVAFWYGLEAFRLRAKADVEEQGILPPAEATSQQGFYGQQQQQQQPFTPPFQQRTEQQPGIGGLRGFQEPEGRFTGGYSLPPGAAGQQPYWAPMQQQSDLSSRWGSPPTNLAAGAPETVVRCVNFNVFLGSAVSTNIN